MKKVLTAILLLFIVTTVKAQEKIPNSTISVSGTAKIMGGKPTTVYRVMSVLSLDELKYTDTYYKTIEEFKEEFFRKLKADKVDVSKFTEDKLVYMSYGYQMDGVVLYYETSSKETVKAIFKNKLKGISAMTLQCKKIYSEDFYDDMMKKALDEAESKANRMAKSTNRKLGKIVKVSGGDPAYTNWNDVTYYKYDEFYSIHVEYNLL